MTSEIYLLNQQIVELRAENASFMGENSVLSGENAKVKTENAEVKTENAKLRRAMEENTARPAKLEQSDKEKAELIAKLNCDIEESGRTRLLLMHRVYFLLKMFRRKPTHPCRNLS
ncbi:3596_t:CDS:1 [Ambispora gerdemannii]|uniref:3596_t:CDS:1 n=1 Tax=Ambispora gerdemannii TaxID=144530 RepID=A0A9N9B4E1_9GLOM|nr:3596_t:CDS:1 [Ambispora gerdemannii]